MRDAVARLEEEEVGVSHQRRSGTPAESAHVGMLAAAIGKQIVVQGAGGRGWYYEAPGGEGGSVFVMWGGDANFDGVSDEWLRREARRAVDVGERCSMCEDARKR